MIGFIFNDKFIKKLSNQISEKISVHLDGQSKTLSELTIKLESIDQKVTELNTRLTNKELKDKVEYGQLVYKVNALKNDLKPKTSSIQKNSVNKSSH